ncbi:hypothetical protein [Robbsia andropogonis]|uniref:hypothetical protein n=1 Tax=Robbsia andropogonis TaxID=28092 RepID=UPI00209E0E63|nr:hypothetical protein [Robbsia andropogonis]MCP1120505.1 hypothetical protein [Robbsia andropogonis]MCP1131286.1 hypothetical protein [Robbsia andropogonis]
MKKWSEAADLALKILSCVAIVAGGGWALWTFVLGGSKDWQLNLSVDASVMPYRDNLRMIVVHVHAKNPRPVALELRSKDHDSYSLKIRQIDTGGKAGDVIEEGTGKIVATADLLKTAGGDYEFLPGADMDDMPAFILPLGSTVEITATVTRREGGIDEDSNATSTVVRVDDPSK